MIFNQFDMTDIVAGRTSRIASGFWPDSTTVWSASILVSGFYDLTQSIATPSPSYGSSIYDIRRTAFYIDVFPNDDYHNNNDPYLSITYGNFYGELGSGSFDLDTGSIKVYPPKTIYTQYKNLLLGSSNNEDQFAFTSGSATSTPDIPDDIWVLNFSSYKMKDRIDEGVFQISFTGSNGCFTFRDDSPFLTQQFNVYDLVSGSIYDSTTAVPPYQGLGLLYPNDGILILNAKILNQIVGLSSITAAGSEANYTPGSSQGVNIPGVGMTQTTVNPQVLFWSIRNSKKPIIVRKSEYVPAQHYFVRVKNRDFNYSNNPTYVYDGNEDNIHARGSIRWPDFVSDPRTYITSIGLYNDNNELVAVAKLSRPALKSFDNELLLKIRLDFVWLLFAGLSATLSCLNFLS